MPGAPGVAVTGITLAMVRSEVLLITLLNAFYQNAIAHGQKGGDHGISEQILSGTQYTENLNKLFMHMNYEFKALLFLSAIYGAR